ncbi:hypothetical protein [Streptomyces sp. NRRL B-24484]|uniref:hypothetical protein n=1 Tax=Streptomyces sp. NRRL B-24484 TaxID=1463833 RepID=UPI0004C03D4C|nr:hypothetical protein [Streptomyces sp. NRRL B-24484]
MRHRHAAPPRPDRPRGGPPRRDVLRRAGKLAAGGALLAQLWGFGPGVRAAGAAEGPGPDLIDRVGAPALLHRLGGDTVPAVEQRTGPVEEVLRDRIRVDGLPLPGQVAAVPDAFAIAAGLLPAVSPPPRGDGGAVPAPATDASAAPVSPAPAAAAPAGASPADGSAAAPRPTRPPGTAVRPAADARGASAERQRPRPAAAGDAFGAAPTVRAEGADAVAVAVPILAGLLLTALATYKHRGLPSGH